MLGVHCPLSWHYRHFARCKCSCNSSRPDAALEAHGHSRIKGLTTPAPHHVGAQVSPYTSTYRSTGRHIIAAAPPDRADTGSPAVGCVQHRQLGATELVVPGVCFGTMLFGESQDYSTAHQLLSACMEAGVNFFDTAEMYPVPQSAETQGLSEQYSGRWMKNHSRDKLIIASKVAGPSGQMTWIRGGPHKLDAANINTALDDSLRRLQTDYIDLYQLHWPDRYVPMFGDLDYDPSCTYPVSMQPATRQVAQAPSVFCSVLACVLLLHHSMYTCVS
eukprot:GHUV01028750.1.p1 GENE.GHUV01028750.1~~GHUV01028750.1.p1  ORF type:complete len:275 (+),score=71.12 GHUV01028750.1:1198-2022(+)